MKGKERKMRRPINKMKRSAVAILAAAMLLSSVNIPGALIGTPAVVNAEGVDETDLHTLTDADNTDDSTMNISNFQEADPFIQTSVFELYNSGNLFVNNEKIKLEAFAPIRFRASRSAVMEISAQTRRS